MAILAVKTAEQNTELLVQRILGCQLSPGRYTKYDRSGTAAEKGKARSITLTIARALGIEMEEND